MRTLNPNDNINQQIIRRAKKVEKEINAAIEIAQRYELVPKQTPQVIKAKRDERGKVTYPRDMFEDDPCPTHGRREEIVYFKEISKAEALELSR